MRELVRLWFDALGDLLGYSLPYAPSAVCQPEVLTRLLNDGSCAGRAAVAVVARASNQGVPSVSSNCENLVLSVAGDNVPDSLFVKLPMASFGTRWFFSVINSWRLESHFFRHVADDLPLRTPVTYATAWHGSRFYLIQENLRDDDTVQLFTNPDMLQGPSLELVHRCLDAFARLHCFHYGLSAQERQQILPLDYHPMLSPTMGALSKVLHRVALAPCKKRHPDVIPADIEAAYLLTQAHWEKMLSQWYGGSLSLLHGDSHLGNFFV
ncbi:MAG: hypothetical protein GY826_12070, partial [Fuerstiella sp.]|nr:hypothetical protein [Fuerstiella sp.]